MVHGGLVGAKVRTLALIALIAGCFIAIAVYSHGAVHPLMNAHMVKSLFQSIVWEAFPFILLGAMLSSIIETWVGSNHLSALLSDSLSGRMTASIMGLVVPVCDCGTIPVARSLRRKGVGESVAFTFALGTPTINLVALISTFIAFHQQWSWVLLRAGAALIIAIVTGIAVHFREEGLLEKWNAVHPNHDHQDVKGLSKWRHATDHSIEELFAVGPFFVISALFAAIAQGLWPMHAVTTFTQHSVWSIVLLMILGSAFSLCSEADAFVAASLTTIFSPGAVMAFLLAGQMIDVRNLMLMPQVFSKKTMAVGLPLAAVMIFSVALLVNRFFTGGWL
ncbi:MAG: permease [Acidibacillus sp.]|nr:permease [Acidibacillus sp.]